VKPVIGITSNIDDDSFRVRAEYAAAIEGSGGVPVILPIGADPAALAEIMDGLLLTGGRDIPPEYSAQKLEVPAECINAENGARIDFELALLRTALGMNKPVMAICYGMQLLNAAHGGTLLQDIQLLSRGAFDHKTGAHDIALLNTPWPELAGTYHINSYHHQAVLEPGEGLEVFARADDGIIEGMYKRDYTFCVGVQWHPERSGAEPLSKWLFAAFIEKAAETRRRRGSGKHK
jgi:putative glutamine amidotransferase